MKKFIKVLSLAVLAVFVIALFVPTECLARRHEKYQENLTDNQQLGEANAIYKKAVRFMERGDGAFRKRPGEAAALYFDAESYLNSTIFKLNELKQKFSIDVSKEIGLCEELWRKTHVKTAESRSMSR
jgi:hypothetical protein